MLLWLLHQKGLFDPLYDWWEDSCGADEKFIMNKHRVKINQAHHHIHDKKHHKPELRHTNRRTPNRRKTSYEHHHKHKNSERNSDHLHHVQKEMHKHRQNKHMDSLQHNDDNNPAQHHKHRKEQEPSTGLIKELRHDNIRHANHDKHKHVLVYDPGSE